MRLLRRAVLAVALLLVGVKAALAFNLVALLLTSALHAAVVWGLIFTHYSVPVTTPAGRVIEIQIQASDSYKAPVDPTLPAGVPPVVGYTNNGDTGYFKYATGTYYTQQELLDALFASVAKTLKTNGSYGCLATDTDAACIARSGAGGFAQRAFWKFDVATNQGCPGGIMPSKSPASTTGYVNVQIASSAPGAGNTYCGTGGAAIVPQSCPPGRVLSGGQCVFDPTKPQSLDDGICAYVRDAGTDFVRNPFDPDCVEVAPYVTAQPPTSTTGGRVVVKPPGGGEVVDVQRKPKPENGANDSSGRVQTPRPGGGTDDTNVNVGPGGQVVGGGGGTRPGNPEAPVSGTPSTPGTPYTPVTSYPGPGTACGAPGQPECAVTMNPGDTSGIDQTLPDTDTPADNAGKLGEFSSLFAMWSGVQMPDAGTCPTISLSFQLMGYQHNYASRDMCDLFDSHYWLIRAVFEACYIFSGIIIIFKA